MVLTKDFGYEGRYIKRSRCELTDPSMPTPGCLKLRIDLLERRQVCWWRVTGAAQLFVKSRAYLADIMRGGNEMCIRGVKMLT